MTWRDGSILPARRRRICCRLTPAIRVRREGLIPFARMNDSSLVTFALLCPGTMVLTLARDDDARKHAAA